MTTHSVKHVSENLGIAEQTVRAWMKEFDIPFQRNGVKLKFSEEAVNIFRTIKNLRDNEHGYTTIRKSIALPKQPNSDSYGIHSDPISTQETTVMPSSEAIALTIESAVDRSMDKQTELAEKYAKATYTIGQLEERIKSIEEKNRILEEQLKLLPEPDQINRLKEELKTKGKLISQFESSKVQEESDKLILIQKQLSSLMDSLSQTQETNEYLVNENKELAEKLVQEKQGVFQRLAKWFK